MQLLNVFLIYEITENTYRVLRFYFFLVLFLACAPTKMYVLKRIKKKKNPKRFLRGQMLDLNKKNWTEARGKCIFCLLNLQFFIFFGGWMEPYTTHEFKPTKK